ncbi:hypothetical protein HanRHA438_Chr03g0103251 [Helianthus annuus]|nr:hypothetical protein HanRHA438_Chr03g0103251 [Helianthus annuus]
MVNNGLDYLHISINTSHRVFIQSNALSGLAVGRHPHRCLLLPI